MNRTKMMLSMLSVLGSLLSLVAAQSCSDQSVNSASWVRLKPLGQCQDEESTCPYRITFPPLTVQLPKPFMKLEKMARELQSLTQMVNQLKEDCRVCKERQGTDWDIRTNNKRVDEEKIQASKGTLNTRKRQLDTVQVTTPRSVVEDTMSPIKDSDVGKQRNTNQDRNVNPRSTKPRAENNRGQKRAEPLQKNQISGSMSNIGGVPSLMTTKEMPQSPMYKPTESIFQGEQPSQHKMNTIKVGHEMYPSGTLTTKGKLKHMGENYEITIFTNDDDNNEDKDDEIKQLQKPKGDKTLEERQLITSNETQYNGKFEPNMKQLGRNQQHQEDRKDVAEPKIKESKYSIFDDSNNGNVSKEGSVREIQQQALKNKGKKEKNSHSAISTTPKQLKPGYSERDSEMNSRPANNGSANDSVNFRQINPQTLEKNSKNQYKPDTNAKMDTAIETKFHQAETVSGHTTTRLPIYGITDGIDHVSPAAGKALDSQKQPNAGTDPESDDELNSSPVNNVDTLSSVKNSKSPNPGSTNATANIYKINPKIKKSDFRTTFKPRTDVEHNTGMDSNPNNKLETSKLQFPGKTNSIDLISRNQQVLHSTNTTSENDAGITSDPTDRFDTISGIRSSGSAISDKANVTDVGDPIDLKRQRSNSKAAPKTSKDPESNIGVNPNPDNGQNNSRSPIPGITNGMTDVPPTDPQIVDIKIPFKDGRDSESDSTVDSNPVNNTETISGHEMLGSHISSRSGGIVDVTPTNLEKPGNKKQFRAETNSESDTVKRLKPVNYAPSDKVNINQINAHMVYSNFENSTVASTPLNKAERVTQLETPILLIPDRSHSTADQINPQQKGYSSEKPLKLDNDSERKATKRDHTTGMVRQKETPESPIFTSRLDVNGTHPSLNINDDLPKRQFLPKYKFNITQSRTGRMESSSSTNVNTERKTIRRNNKTTPLRSDAMTSGRHLPSEILFMKPGKQKEVTNQKERIRPPGISLGKNPIYRKQINPGNKNKAFVNKRPKNTHGVTNYSMSNETTHVHAKAASSLNNDLNNTTHGKSWFIRPTLATHGILGQAHKQRAKTTPTVKALDIGVNHQIENTSQTTLAKSRPEKPGVSSPQGPGLKTVNNIERNSETPIMEKTKGIDRTGQVPSKTSNVDSNQENYKKTYKSKNMQNLDGKMTLDARSTERNKLNHPTTPATQFIIKPEFKGKNTNIPQFIKPFISTTHFMDQDSAEQSRTKSENMKVSNIQGHHRLESPSKETESKISQSDNGSKEKQNASGGQGFNAVRSSKPNSVDSTQNTATGTMTVIVDTVKASIGSKMSTENANDDETKVSNSEYMDTIKASTEKNWITPLSDNSPEEYHKSSKASLRVSDSVKGNNGEHSKDNGINNGNFYPVIGNRMTGATLKKNPPGHTNNEDNKKPLGFKDIDDSLSLEKKLLSNCHGQCDLSPTVHPILNSRESVNNDRVRPPHDCSDFVMGNLTNGIYNITPTGSSNRTFPVFCDMKSSGGGWTLIQQRLDGRVSFNRAWNDYKRGFGNLTGEFWLGNDKIHWLTATKAMLLRIELEDLDGMKKHAQYDRFHVANESQFYRMTIEGYSGTAGDAMRFSQKFNHTQKNFTTPDRDNDQYASGNCGAYYSSGWWFDACMAANLNGKYYQTKYRGVRNGIFWGTWHNISTESYLTHYRQSFKTVRMMIRPRGFIRTFH